MKSSNNPFCLRTLKCSATGESMKTLLLILAVLTSTTAHGGEFTQFGKILFQSASTWVPGNKTCVSEGNIYHRDLEAIPVERCNNDDKTNCTVELRPLEQPIVSTRQRCVAYSDSDNRNCVKWETVPFKQGPELKVEVYASEKDIEDNRTPRKILRYTIPSCQ